MQLMDFVARKEKELRDLKHKNVTFKDASEAEQSERTISFALFTAKKVPMDAVVLEIPAKPNGFKGEAMHKVAQVVFSSIPPRCRKPQTQYFYAYLSDAPDACWNCHSGALSGETFPPSFQCLAGLDPSECQERVIKTS